MLFISNRLKVTPLVKGDFGKYEDESNYICTYNLDNSFVDKHVNLDTVTKKERPDFEVLKEVKDVSDIDVYNYKYPLGFFAGCNSFSFRITLKEYRMGLKASKFSLLLNQFNLNLERFIFIIEELLNNAFSLEFFDRLFGSLINDIDLKIHFLIVLSKRDKYNTSSKFSIIPKGCYIIHLRRILWSTIFSDYMYTNLISRCYKGFKRHIGLLFLLNIFYIYKLLHSKISLLVNKYKIYDYEERAFESIGNVLNISYNSFKLYCGNDLRMLRHSYFFSFRCLSYLSGGDLKTSIDLDYLGEDILNIIEYYDLVNIDLDVKQE